MDDDWIRFDVSRPGTDDRIVWLGNIALVHPEPVLSYAAEYNRLRGGVTQWTHWKLCQKPNPPRRTPHEIALTALQTSRAAGWTDSQLVAALISETKET